jgi:hypothetical protein
VRGGVGGKGVYIYITLRVYIYTPFSPNLPPSLALRLCTDIYDNGANATVGKQFKIPLDTPSHPRYNPIQTSRHGDTLMKPYDRFLARCDEAKKIRDEKIAEGLDRYTKDRQHAVRVYTKWKQDVQNEYLDAVAGIKDDFKAEKRGTDNVETD